MSTTVDLESRLDELTAIRDTLNGDYTIDNDKRNQLEERYKAINDEYFEAKIKAATSVTSAFPPSYSLDKTVMRKGGESMAMLTTSPVQRPTKPEPVGKPHLADLESKCAEYEQKVQEIKSDWSIPNAKKREMSIEWQTVRRELRAARREAEADKRRAADASDSRQGDISPNQDDGDQPATASSEHQLQIKCMLTPTQL
ncbi:hypothetical protein NLG97_g8964 [Lecanicillium saksenae]|uniref:Uncharacterized protein n=1 Tax=Lecanicillium saksenae TaxID=468837 RepID=A0ACC1QHK9_9HYPO|nr:hypothetical protein NLG97_g8964 [Lecanicillium saksenae]